MILNTITREYSDQQEDILPFFYYSKNSSADSFQIGQLTIALLYLFVLVHTDFVVCSIR